MEIRVSLTCLPSLPIIIPAQCLTPLPATIATQDHLLNRPEMAGFENSLSPLENAVVVTVLSNFAY